jgi:DNA-binding XRE family transcriptional regulator
MKSFESYRRRALKKTGIRAEYDRLGPEFAVARTLIAARMSAKMTQGDVARRMGTSQSAVARMESGRALPSTTSLVKYAQAVGRKLVIGLN